MYGNNPGERVYGACVEVPAEAADQVKGYAAMLLKDFKWTKFSAFALPVKLNGHTIVAIVDTGIAGVVILKSCYNCLWMNCDEEVKFTITSATDTNKKLRKVLFGVKVTVGRKTVMVPTIVLEGPHFNVLLE